MSSWLTSAASWFSSDTSCCFRDVSFRRSRLKSATFTVDEASSLKLQGPANEVRRPEQAASYGHWKTLGLSNTLHHALKTIVADTGSPHKLAGRAPDS